MKRLYRILLFTSCFITSVKLNAMEQKTRAWRDELYHNAFLGEAFAQFANSVDEQIDYVSGIDYASEQRFDTPRTTKILHDWVYTLDVIDKKLLRKPFHIWTIEDILLCVASLSRLSEEDPKAYRSYEEHRIVRNFTDEEKKRYFPLLKKFLTEFHEEHGSQKLPQLHMVKSFYPEGAACFHTTPADIEKELKKAFEKAQIAFKDNYENWGKNRETIFITIAAQLAFDIMRIRPFKQATVRLGLVLTFVIFKQAGLVPVSVKKRADYIKALVKCLKYNDIQPLVNYWNKALSECPMEELLKELDMDSACLWPVVSSRPRTECIIPCDDIVLKTTPSHEKAPTVFQIKASDSQKLVKIPVGDGSVNTAQETSLAIDEQEEAYALELALGMLKHKNKIVTVPLCNHPECLCRMKKVQVEIDTEINRKQALLEEKDMLERQMVSIKDVLSKIKLCGNCGQSENGIKLQICSRCKYEYYCGKECQKEDWPNHKLVCFPPEADQ